MTRKPPRKPSAPKGDPSPLTLAQFSAALDDHHGKALGFADAVRRLYRARVQIAQVKEDRGPIREHCRRAYEIGHRVIGSTGYEITMTQPPPPTTYRAAPSAAVKKASLPAWEAAHAPAGFIQIKAPQEEAAAVPHIEVPADRKFIPPAEAVRTYMEHPAWSVGRRLKEVERDEIAHLEKIAAEAGWDGGAEKGALVLADGWSVQLARSAYSEEKLRKMDPALWDQVAVTKIKQVAPRLIIRKVREDYEGDDEGDDDGE